MEEEHTESFILFGCWNIEERQRKAKTEGMAEMLASAASYEIPDTLLHAVQTWDQIEIFFLPSCTLAAHDQAHLVQQNQ